MADPVLATINGYIDRGPSGFANLTLPSGEPLFISVSRKGLRLHHIILWGYWPGRTHFKANAAQLGQMVRVLARDVAKLPKLPDKAAMDSFLVIATRAITDPSVYQEYQRDEEGEPITTLALLTRAALGEPDVAGIVRRFSRAAATP